MDSLTQKFSIHEVFVSFGLSTSAAEQQITTIRAKYPGLAEAVGSPMYVNGMNHAKLCADLETMLQFVWLLPSSPLTVAFRRKCATDIARQLRGDISLVEQIESNHATLEQTGGLHFCAELSSETPVFCDQANRASASSLPLSICAPTSSHCMFDEYGMYDLLQLLIAATGWDINQCIRAWIDLCVHHPRLHSGWLDEPAQILYVPKALLVELADSVDWGAVVLRHTGHAACEATIDVATVTFGNYYPITTWHAIRAQPTVLFTWVRMCIDLDNIPRVELATAIRVRYARADAQVVRMRRQWMSDNVTGVHKISSVACIDGVTRQCVSWDALRQMISYFDRKGEAEAERMHEHDKAKMYIHDRVLRHRSGMCAMWASRYDEDIGSAPM